MARASGQFLFEVGTNFLEESCILCGLRGKDPGLAGIEFHAFECGEIRENMAFAAGVGDEAPYFRVIRFAEKEQGRTVCRCPGNGQLGLLYPGTCGVDQSGSALAKKFLVLPRNTMGSYDHNVAGCHAIQLLQADNALGFIVCQNLGVVDNGAKGTDAGLAGIAFNSLVQGPQGKADPHAEAGCFCAFDKHADFPPSCATKLLLLPKEFIEQGVELG